MIPRAVAIWFLLLAAAMIAGVLRSALLAPRAGVQPARVIGTLVVVVIFCVTIAVSVRWIDPVLVPRRLFLLGLAWVLATMVFEFGFGHWVAGHPWSRLLADYDLTAGRIWALVLLAVFSMPSLAGAWLRGR